MKKTVKLFLGLGTVALAACVQSQVASNSSYSGDRKPAETAIIQQALPPINVSAAESEKIWSSYCVGNRKSTEIPVPNYSNAEVINVVGKLTMIYPQSYYFYSGPLYAYGLKNGKDLVDVPAHFPEVPEVKNGKKNAHAFLTLLCGEFRDRPTLIKEKIKWASRIYKLPVQTQGPIDMSDNVWSKMTAQSYLDYISISSAIYYMKLGYQNSSKDESISKVVMGKYKEPAPVDPYTVCETKYIFQKYVIPGVKSVGDYKTYTKDYRSFRQKKCTKDDIAYIYDFRGDSNYKPNSPESNGMIWYSSTIGNSCTRKDGKMVLKDSVKDKFTNKDICEDYFKAPFAHRWTAARAGLAAWLFNSKETDDTFSESGSNVTIKPNYDQLNTAFDYAIYGTVSGEKVLPEWTQNKSEFWKRPDIGFNAITGLGTSAANKEFAFERLRNSVNRHTDWYSSGYDDQISGQVKDQAYSPFVASSFEMSASDGFTSPGVTVSSPADGCKHWMFVFKIKQGQWYSNRAIAEKRPVDFNSNWFDETSIGTVGLADSERALDRLGTALEGEMDSILYLNNLSTYGGGPKDNCGAGFIK